MPSNTLDDFGRRFALGLLGMLLVLIAALLVAAALLSLLSAITRGPEASLPDTIGALRQVGEDLQAVIDRLRDSGELSAESLEALETRLEAIQKRLNYLEAASDQDATSPAGAHGPIVVRCWLPFYH
jgi:hypothetical protein